MQYAHPTAAWLNARALRSPCDFGIPWSSVIIRRVKDVSTGVLIDEYDARIERLSATEANRRLLHAADIAIDVTHLEEAFALCNRSFVLPDWHELRKGRPVATMARRRHRSGRMSIDKKEEPNFPPWGPGARAGGVSTKSGGRIVVAIWSWTRPPRQSRRRPVQRRHQRSRQQSLHQQAQAPHLLRR